MTADCAIQANYINDPNNGAMLYFRPMPILIIKALQMPIPQHLKISQKAPIGLRGYTPQILAGSKSARCALLLF